MGRDGDREREPEEAETVVQSDDSLSTAETRVLSDDAPPLAARDAAAGSEAAEGLAEDDDRTQLVTRPPAPSSQVDPPGASTDSQAEPSRADRGGSLKPTRVLDPGAGRPGDTLEASVEDKTAPPSAGAAVPPTPSPTQPQPGLTPGSVLFGEYEIVNVLGVGGMGEVYRAHHRRLDEDRAIKVMHAELSKKKGANEFFYREAKALLAVRHPAVVHCHDLLSDDQGRVYLIMEMIEGIPLSKKMNEGPLSPDDVAILGARVAHGLSAAHRKGVIHRDVSPDNIVLPNGRVQEAKLIDFGIAKILEEGEGTIVDGFKGKLSYASPEQLGFFGGKIDGRSDFYSLGLVLVAAALGRPMGMGTTVMEAVDARRGFEVLPDEIPIGLRSAIQPLLALDPKDRPKYVDRLFVVPGGIDALADPGGYSSGDHTASSSGGTKSPSRAGLYGGLAAVLAVVLGTGAFWSMGVGGAVNEDSSPAELAEAQPVETTAPQDAAAEPQLGAPLVATPTQEIETATPQPVVAKAPERPKRLTARDRIRIIGLLSNAKIALAENRLMSPAGDNAYERYRSVLSMDPANLKARAGLREVALRYLGLANASAARGDTDQARTFLARARQADASSPGLEAAEANLAR
jgi:serine/threonine-protein kinase